MKKSLVLLVAFNCLYSIADEEKHMRDNRIDESSIRSLEEIVVTARRREENLQDIPVAVTAFTPEIMKEKGITTPYDLIGKVPSLTVQGGSATRNDVLFFIRGQGQTFGSNPSVIQYFADVPVYANATSGGSNATFFDLENLQVLKGPQGTLFGRSTTGGAVLINPKKPSYEFDGFVEVKLGNYSSRDLTGAINIPLVDQILALRLAFNKSSHDGYTKSRITGQRLDDRNRDSYRAGLLFEPVEWFSNYTLFQNTNIDENGSATILAYLNENHPLLRTDTLFTSVGQITGRGIVELSVCPAAVTFYGQNFSSCSSERVGRINNVRNGLIEEMQRINSGGDDAVRTSASNQNNFLLSHTQLFTNITEIKFSDIGIFGDTVFKNIFSTNRNLKSYVIREIAGSPVPHGFVYNSLDVVNGEPVINDKYGKTDWGDVFSNEIQFSGTIKNIHNWQLGYFYERDDKNAWFNTPSFFGPLDGAFSFPVGVIGISNGFVEDYRYENSGGYAQTTIDLSEFGAENFKLTLGYRYSEFKQRQTSVPASITDSGIIRTPGGNKLSGDLSQEESTYTLALDWQVNDDMLIYATHRRGYKPGGLNTLMLQFVGLDPRANESFEPETVKDYEVGVKLDWTLGNIYGRTNFAMYQSEYGDLHRNEVLFINNATPAQIGNIAAAETKGLEIENITQLTDNSQLSFNYSYLDAQYTEWPGTVTNSAGEIVDLIDQDYSGAPEHIFGVFYQYQFSFFPEELGAVKTSLHYSYQSRVILGDGQQYNAVDESQDPYGLTNFRLDWENVFGNPVDLSFYIRNITDEVYGIANASLLDATGQVGRVYGDPRTFGLEFRARFGESAN